MHNAKKQAVAVSSAKKAFGYRRPDTLNKGFK